MERKAGIQQDKAIQNPFTTVRCDRNLLDEAYFIVNAQFQKEGRDRLTRESLIELALKSYLSNKQFR